MIKIDLELIKHKRNEFGLSMKNMADSLGFKNASTYLKYEKGEYSFKAEHLPILSNLLKCEIKDFFIQNVAKIETYN
jgi:predicted transcriptional regulator